MTNCTTSALAKRHGRRRRMNGYTGDREPSPRIVSVFRRPDNTVCHARCGRPLSLQGVRALLEADFYCYACLAHVTIPLLVLDTMPVVAQAAF
ncbi:MAG: hypothetical protein AUH29_10215 [Candidatus Rokubacteria bacterium 13_1_40CM_69_27]|nr:MAG: hypothetical protein AUH29_10215 [Candidatus Rokubacteria bacterium 13_1_40CM_69_27]OLC39698.1 MAG: hypothetical protein AUH81_00795 [Candidatus Rokubacteria bacterium 13_1_40CM_4_69_5]